MEKKETKILLSLEEIIKKRKADPEQILFLSVILQAMLDATKPKTPRESTEAIIARETAMSWFFCSVGVTADDFMTVCDIADVDPDSPAAAESSEIGSGPRTKEDMAISQGRALKFAKRHEQH